jgi:hypothetical protein
MTHNHDVDQDQDQFVKNVLKNKLLVPLWVGCDALSLSTKTARNQIAAGTFPLKTVLQGGRRFIATTDLVEYYQRLIGDSDPDSPKKPEKPAEAAGKRGRGRPRKMERATK